MRCLIGFDGSLGGLRHRAHRLVTFWRNMRQGMCVWEDTGRGDDSMVRGWYIVELPACKIEPHYQLPPFNTTELHSHINSASDPSQWALNQNQCPHPFAQTPSPPRHQSLLVNSPQHPLPHPHHPKSPRRQKTSSLVPSHSACAVAQGVAPEVLSHANAQSRQYHQPSPRMRGQRREELQAIHGGDGIRMIGCLVEYRSGTRFET